MSTIINGTVLAAVPAGMNIGEVVNGMCNAITVIPQTVREVGYTDQTVSLLSQILDTGRIRPGLMGRLPDFVINRYLSGFHSRASLLQQRIIAALQAGEKERAAMSSLKLGSLLDHMGRHMAGAAERSWLLGAVIAMEGSDIDPRAVAVAALKDRKAISDHRYKDEAFSMPDGRGPWLFSPGCYHTKRFSCIYKIFGYPLAIEIAARYLYSYDDWGVLTDVLDESQRRDVIDESIAKLEAAKALGLHVPTVYAKYGTAIVRDFVEGPTYRQLGDPTHGLSRDEVGDARAEHRRVIAALNRAGIRDRWFYSPGELRYNLGEKKWVVDI